MSDQDLDSEAIEPYADVKILATLAGITLVIFVLAVIGAIDVAHAVRAWFS